MSYKQQVLGVKRCSWYLRDIGHDCWCVPMGNTVLSYCGKRKVPGFCGIYWRGYEFERMCSHRRFDEYGRPV